MHTTGSCQQLCSNELSHYFSNSSGTPGDAPSLLQTRKENGMSSLLDEKVSKEMMMCDLCCSLCSVKCTEG